MSVRSAQTETGFTRATGVVTLLAIGLLMVGCNKVEEATDTVKDAASDATQAAGDAAESVASALGAEFDAASDAAKSALESVDGGGEIMTKMSQLFTSAQDAVHDVADGDAAQSAAGKLDELTQGLEGMAEMTSKLPAEARTAVTTMVEQGIAQLEALVDKIDPTISSVVKPKLEALVAKLKSL